ncbi:MAG: hypothetical protein HOV81_25170 [Kofleriaceae bacterium]|nr:hypothetical protein [Kofleriaceae bacterium]
MLMHGDFATFVTNFAPTLGDPASPASGLAPFLASRGVDVWGVDRRWTLPAADGDVSDFAAMGVAQELDDVGAVLALARTMRLAGGSGGDKLALIGFSHGAQLAYAYASIEATRPAALRHVDALVPLDYYGELGPDQADMKQTACENSAAGYEWVAEGFIDSPNDFQIVAGQLAASAPDDPSPLIDGMTNREVMLLLVGQTYVFAPLAPLYHLLAPALDGGAPTGLTETTETAANAWLAGSPPHESFVEAVDFDALICGKTPPVDAPLSRIRVPLFYIGAAGGVGDLGLYSTTRVASTDVRTLVLRKFGPERRAEDFGHADLLYSAAARSLAWEPLAAWLAAH